MKLRMTLRGRILLPVLAILAAGLALMLTTVIALTAEEFRKASFEENKNIAHRYAQEVTVHLATIADSARSAAQAFQALRKVGGTSREQYDAVLKAVVAGHPTVLAAWSLWEPNALDGQDRRFAGKAGHDPSGRYNTTWTQASGGPVLSPPIAQYETPGTGDFYLIPKADKKERFLEPYKYSYTGKPEDEILMTSYVVPIVEDGTFLGVIAVDVDLKLLRELTKDVKIFGKGYLVVTSNTGTRLSHPKPEQIGKVIGDDTPDQQPGILKDIAAGQDHIIIKPNLATGSISLLHFAPVGLGLWDGPWSLVAVAPLDQLLATQNLMTTVAASLGTITFLAIGLAILLLVTRITKPVTVVAGILRTIADGEGDLTQRLGLSRTDEIGDLARSYDAFVDKLSDMIRRMQGTSHRLQESGAELASALTETAASLHQITSNIQSAKDNIIQQEGIAGETSAAVQGISSHVTTLQDLVQRQERAVESSGSAVEQMVGNIESVTRNVETLDRSLHRLVEAAEVGRSQFASFRDRVGSVDGQSASLQETNDVIASIASQTNLLAMNAAIEAAHAGEAGRGFAVVADEIRKLAEQASLQSKSTASELKALQGTIRALVGDADTTEGAFGRILEEIGQVEALESEVRTAMTEQQVGSRQILEGIGEIRDSSQQVSSHSGEMLDEADRTLRTMETLHRVTLEIRQGMDEIATGASDINQALAVISEQGVKNKESVDELAEETGQFRLR